MKRGISILLTICMILALIPNKAAAAETAAFSEPSVTALTVSYDGGETQNLLENQSAILLPAGSKPVFAVTFDNSEPLNQVFVTSTKNGETKYLEAKPQGGQYVTDDYFDPSEVNYIPGTISVTYSKKTVKVGESGGTDLNTLKAQLSSQGISSRNETTEADGTVTAQVVLGDMFGAMANECFDAAVSEFTVGAGIDQGELDRWLGVYQNLSELSSYDLEGVDGKQYTLYLSDKDFGDTDTYLVMVKDATSNKYTKMLLNKAAGSVGLGDIFDALSAANVVSKKLLEYRAISKDTAALREEIEAHPTMTRQEKAEANAEADAWDRDRKLFLIGMTAVAILVPPASAPLMISVLTAGYSAIADYFWDYRVGMIKGCEPIENVFSESGDHPGWVELTDYRISESGNYFLTTDFSILQISENARITLCLHGHTIKGITTMNSGSTLAIQDCKYKEHSDGSITGGMISRTILMEDQNELTLEQGIIAGVVSRGNGGKITINGGMMTGGIADDGGSGKITINSGTLSGGIRVNSSNVTINGGIINADRHIVDTLDPNGNSDATVQINGGELSGSFRTNIGSITVNMKQGSISGDIIRSGNVLFQNGTCTGNINGNDIIITGGSISGRVSGTNITMEGGSIGSASFSTGTTAVITGGVVNGPISNYRDSRLTINGGIIKGNISNSNSAQLTISNGTVLGGITNYNNKTTLLITNDSDIQISGSPAFDSAPTVKADSNYNNDITYYSSIGSQGVKITIQEAANVDFGQMYVRFVSGTSSNPPADHTHVYLSDVISPTCTTAGYTTYICTECGEAYTDSHTPPLGHSYGAWNTIQSATPTATGLQERVCSRCGDRETRVIPATGESGGSAEGSGSHSSDRDSDPGPSYPVNEPKTENGSLSISPKNAVSGAIVTVTVKPDAGYELDTLTVTNKGGRQVRVTSKGNGQYTFRMPGSEAEIRATFKPIMSFVPAAAGTFSDVPTDHWAGTEISWALENGVMNGVGDGKFNPNGTVTRQQLWMTLARMAGEAPVDMAAAKIWAVNNSISDGSAPGNTITRQQMAVILYRFAKLMGHSVAGNGDLSPYSDSGEISSYAGEAMAWAVGSGILNGTADGALNPNGTATRVQMAVILYRFYSRVIHV